MNYWYNTYTLFNGFGYDFFLDLGIYTFRENKNYFIQFGNYISVVVYLVSGT